MIYVLVKSKDEEEAVERLKREVGFSRIHVVCLHLFCCFYTSSNYLVLLNAQILNTELFRCLREMHGGHYKDFTMRKIVPVVGNIEEDNIGIGTELVHEISKEVDVIINSAANTVFDERFIPMTQKSAFIYIFIYNCIQSESDVKFCRYDVALDINTLGPSKLMNFARRCEKLKLFLHVSTGQA